MGGYVFPFQKFIILEGNQKHKRFLILWNRDFQDGGNTLAHVLAHPSLDGDCDSLANAREARADLISVCRAGQVGFKRSPGEARRYSAGWCPG